MVTQSKKKTGENGFTLVELIVIIAILGILSAIAVVGVGGAIRTANINACKADWNAVNSAASAYITDNTTMPTNTTTSQDVYTKSGLLASSSYLSPLTQGDKYQIKLTWNTSDATVSVYNASATAQIPSSGARNAAADCEALP